MRSIAASQTLCVMVPKGEARNAAETLACELAALPQSAWRADLRSMHDNAFDTDLARALQREGANGYRAVFDDGLEGAARFVTHASAKGRAP